tara:strand:+ start:36 stop:647 length:612 start_codon:yes stop_codon:yes gene_type:complete
MARHSMIIIDDFYSNPHAVREEALNMKWYDKKGNHPGKRTDSVKDPSVKAALEGFLNQKIESTQYDDLTNHNGCYNLCTALDKCWVHSDNSTNYACVIYLTPNAPIESGTAIYRHKRTGLMKPPRNKDGTLNYKLHREIQADGQDFTCFEQIDYAANIFNRAIIYDADYFHAAVQYFGSGPEYCRLHQTFFFNTIKEIPVTIK